jgi:O-antigen ligase
MTIISAQGRWLNRGTLTRVAIPLVTLVLAIIIGARIEAFEKNISFVLAGLVALAGAAVAVRYGTFERGLMAVVLTAGLTNFFTLPTGRDTRLVVSMVLALLLVGLWLFRMLFHSRTGERIRPSPINKPVLLFVGICIISFVWSFFMRDPLLKIWPSFPLVQAGALALNIGLPLLLLLTANKINSSRWIRAFMWVLVGFGLLNIVSRFLNLPTIQLVENASRGLFTMWVGGFAWALLLYDRKLRGWQRAMLVLVLLGQVAYYFFVTRYWVSGWLPMFVVLAIITLFRSRRLFAVMSALALIVIALNFDTLYRTVVVGNEEEGGLERLALWQMNLQHVVNHPVFGMGPAGYAIYNMTYHPEDARSTHNNYFDVLAQTGVTGFIAFLSIMVTMIVVGGRTLRAVRGRGDSDEAFAAAALAGVFGAMVGMMLGDWVLPFAYNQTLTGFDNASFTWMSLGLLASLYHMTRAPAKTP